MLNCPKFKLLMTAFFVHCYSDRAVLLCIIR